VAASSQHGGKGYDVLGLEWPVLLSLIIVAAPCAILTGRIVRMPRISPGASRSLVVVTGGVLAAAILVVLLFYDPRAPRTLQVIFATLATVFLLDVVEGATRSSERLSRSVLKVEVGVPGTESCYWEKNDDKD